MENTYCHFEFSNKCLAPNWVRGSTIQKALRRLWLIMAQLLLLLPNGRDNLMVTWNWWKHNQLGNHQKKPHSSR